MSGTIRVSFDTTTNKDLLKGSVRKLFDDTVRQAKVESKVMYNDLKTKDEYERDARIGALTYPADIGEGQNIPIQLPPMGQTKTYTQKQTGTGFRITHKMDMFNKYKLTEKFTKDLGVKMAEGKDVDLASPFNSMESTSLACGTGFDSLAIASTAHTGLRAGTTSDNYSNYLNADLSKSAVVSARYYFATKKDAMGYWSGAVPTHLFYESTLWDKAQELFRSDNAAHEQSNTINILPDLKLKLFEYHRLTSTTCWGMIAKNERYDFNCFTALEPKVFVKDASDDTLDKVIIAIQYYTFGWGDAGMLYCGNT